jgi:Ca2+-binding EF-hand superfamily protein
MIESWFRRYDKNGDGLLNNDEMPEALKAERDRWDTNKDGFIDLNEFKAYAQARMQQAQADRGAQGFGGGWGGPGAMPVPELPVENEKEQRPVVYRANNLPAELPAWFKEADTDQDGQVGLYEWKAKGWSVEEFVKMDRNNDGFLTVEEVLRYQKEQSGTAVAAASPGGGDFATAAGNGVPGFGNGRPGFGNMQGGFGNRPRGGFGGQGNGNGGQGNGGGRRRGGPPGEVRATNPRGG